MDSYPISEWNGGKVHFITPSIIHLMRGQVYNINGKTFFTMGGAESTDKYLRKENISWWAREMPNMQEYSEGFNNLNRYNNEVDYILAHSAPDSILDYFSHGIYHHNQLTNYLQILIDTINFRHMYFGHYHFDRQIKSKFTSVYNNIIELL